MHGHLTDATEDAFPLLIMNGVTGVRDMGGDLAQIDRWRSQIRDGTLVGPHILRAGPFVDGPKDGVTNRLTVRTPEEARQAVRKLRNEGVDFIKVHNALPPEAFFALMEEARTERLPVGVHLPMGVSSAEASDAGVASLEHIETINESALFHRLGRGRGGGRESRFARTAAVSATRPERNLVRPDARRLRARVRAVEQ